jgi:phosphate transport system substrate-binding protein
MKTALLPVIAAFWPVFAAAAVLSVDGDLEPFQPAGDIQGSLSVKGSDLLGPAAQDWIEALSKAHPNLRISMEAKSSGLAPTALLDGSADLGPMSRPMTKGEMDALTAKWGFPPTQVKVALDAVAIAVNVANPVEQLDARQLDGILSSTHRSGSPNVSDWGAIGGSAGPIHIYGRDPKAGSTTFLEDGLLMKGKFKAGIRVFNNNPDIARAVADDPGGIGYVSIAVIGDRVKALKILVDGDPTEASPEQVYASKYPLRRQVYVYCKKRPGQPLDPAAAEFLRYALSKEGQESVAKNGLIPLRATTAATEGFKIE